MKRLLQVLLATAYTAQAQEQDSSTNDLNPTVVIIGAGFSGIAAAKELYESGVDFMIIEAHEEIGGRVKSTKIQEYTLELGANWIHSPISTDGSPNNTMWQYKQALDLEGSYSNYSNYLALDAIGEKIPHSIFDKYEEKLYEALEEICYEGLSNDISLAECLEKSGYRDELPEYWTIESSVADFVEWYELDFMEGVPLDQTSYNNSFGHWYDEAPEFEEGDFLITDQRGFNLIAHHASKPFSDKIINSEKVSSIESFEEGATIYTESGLVVDTEYVICTIPLGVLKSGDIQFTPKLSPEKQERIDKMLFAHYAKVTLKFPENFWGDSEHLHVLTQDIKLSYPFAINLEKNKYIQGSTMLSFHVVEEMAEIVESQPVNDTQDQIMTLLRNAFGDQIPDPEDILVSDWTNNPLSYGTWASMPVGWDLEDSEILQQNEGRIFFAGEYLSKYNIGTTHGAYDSGTETACNVLQELGIPCAEYVITGETSQIELFLQYIFNWFGF